MRRRKVPAVAEKALSDFGEAQSPEDSVETQKQPGIHSSQTPYGRRLELEHPDPPPLELMDLDQLSSTGNYMPQLITGDRPHSDHNYAMYEIFPGPGLRDEGGYYRPGYEHSNFMQDISGVGAFEILTTADTGREVGDAEAQQLTSRHVTQSLDSIDIANLEHDVGPRVQSDPWSSVNLRKSLSVLELEHKHETWPAIGPLPPSTDAASSVSRYLKTNRSMEPHTGISLKGSSQVTESSAESRPNVALSSTLPTSRGAHVYENECPIDKQVTADLRDSETIYSLGSAVDDDRYIAAFAHRLLSDLTLTATIQDLSNLHPDFVKQTLKLFATRLHWESTNLFERATSVVLHKKRG